MTQDEIDSGELDYQLSKLKKNTVFVDYLDSEQKGKAIGTFADLENYVRGREAQANGNDKAASYYEACLHYFDAGRRYDELHQSMGNEHYDLAMELFRNKQYEEAYEEFKLAGNYEDSADRMEYINDILGWDLGHVHQWIPATCDKPKTCSGCGATEGEPKGHDFDSGRVTLQPTCGKNGEKVYTCKECGATQKETIPATGKHDYDEGVTTAAQTCTASGKITKTCRICRDKQVTEIPKTGSHTWDEGTITKKRSVRKTV